MHIPKKPDCRKKITSVTPLLLRICLVTLTILIFTWISSSFAQTSRDETDISSLDLKWLSASPSLLGFDKVKLDTTIENIGRMNGIYSVIVVRNNYLVREQYFREGSRLKPHNLKSATKSVLSALIGIAIDKGYLHLDQPVSDFLPQVNNLDDQRKADITVRHLLTMSSGLEPTSYQAYNSWIMNGTDWVQTILNRPLIADPGTKHQYSTGDTHILSAVLTGATRMSTREFAERNLFGPLAISVKGWEIDPQGISQGGNNLSIIPLDMALFGQLYLDEGIYRNRQVVPKWWVETSTRPNYMGEHEVYGHYGYLWYARPLEKDAFVAVGYGGQYIYVSPEYNTVIVITSTLQSKGKAWERELFDYIQEGILESIEPDLLLLQQVGYDSKTSSGLYQNTPFAKRTASDEKPIGLATANLNLRKGPGQTNPVIKLLDAGTVMEIQEKKSAWLRVRALNLEGWVSAKYVRFIEPEKIRFARYQEEKARPVKQMQAEKVPSPIASVSLSSQQEKSLKDSQKLISQLQKNLEISEKTKQQIQGDLTRAREKLAAAQETEVNLAAERKALEKELTGLHEEVYAQGTGFEKLQSNRDSLKTELAAVQKEMAEQEKIGARSAAAQKELEIKLAEALKQIEVLEETQEQLRRQEAGSLTKLEQKLYTEQVQLQNVEQTLQDAQAKGSEISATLTEATRELETQKQALAQSEVERKKLEQELAGLLNQLDSQTGTLTTVQSKRDTLQAELLAMQQETTARQERVSRSESLQKKLETELTAAREQIANLQRTQATTLDQTANDTQQLEQELNAAREQVATLKKQLLELQATDAEIKAKYAQAGEEFNKRQQKNMLLEESRDTLQTELFSMQKQMAAQQEQAKQSETVKKELESQLAATMEQIKKLVNEESETEKKAAQARQQLEQELSAGQEHIATVEQQLVASQARNKEIIAELARLGAELKIQQQTTALGEAAQKSLADELAGIEAQLKSQTKTLTTVQTKRDFIQAELAALKQEFAAQQQIVQQTSADKNEFENKLAAAEAQIDELRLTHRAALVLATEAKEQLETGLAEEQTLRMSVEKQLQDSEARNNDVRSELSRANKRIEGQKFALTELKAAHEKSDLRLAWLQKDLEVQLELVAESNSARKNLETELAVTKTKIEMLTKKEQQLTEDVADKQLLEQELAAERSNLEVTRKQLHDLESQHKEITALHTRITEEFEKQIQANTESETARKKIEMELAGMLDQLDTQSGTLKTVMIKRDGLKADLAEVQKELRAEKQIATETTAVKTALETELATIRAQMDELGETQRQLITQAAKTQNQLKQEIDAEQNKVIAVAARLQESQKNKEKISAQMHAVNDALEKQKLELDRSETVRESLKEQLSEYQDKIAYLSEELKSERTSVDTLKIDLGAFQKEINALQQVASHSAATNKKLETELASASAKIVTLEKSRLQLTTQAEKTKAALEKDLVFERDSLNKIEAELAAQQNKVANLEGSMQLLQAERDNLKAEIGTIQNEMAAQQVAADRTAAAKVDLESQLAANRLQIEKLNTKQNQTLEQAAKTKQQLEEDLSAERTTLKNIETELESAQTNSKELTERLATFKKELANQEINTAQIDSERKTLKAQLTQIQKQLETKLSSLTTVQAKRDSLQKELAGLQQKLAAQEKITTETAAAKTALETELVTSRSEIDELGEMQRQLIAQAAKTQKQLGLDLNAEKDKVKSVEIELQASQKNEENLAAQLATVKNDLEKQKQETTRSETAQKELQTDLAAQQSKIATLEKNLQSNQTSRASLQAELADMYPKMAALQEMTTQTTANKKELEKTLTSTHTEIASLQDKQRQKAAQAEKTRAAMDKELIAERENLKIIATQLQAVQKDKQGLTEELNRVKSTLETQKQVALESETNRKKLEAEVAVKQSKNVSLEENLKALQADRSSLMAEIKSLQKNMATKQGVVSQATSTQKQVEGDLARALAKIEGLNKIQQEITVHRAHTQKQLQASEASNKKLEAELVASQKQIKELQNALTDAKGPGKEQVDELAADHTAAQTKKKMVVVAKPVQKVAEPGISAEKLPYMGTADAFVRSWSGAWEQKNVPAYLSHYSRNFSTPGGISMNAWKKQRYQRLGKPKFIKIGIRDVKIEKKTDTSARAIFIQKYQSDTFSDQVVKTLEMKWENGAWTIVKETSKKL